MESNQKSQGPTMKLLMFVLAFYAATSNADANDFTLKIHKHDGGSKKHCYVDFEIDLNGNWTSKALYSNGHQLHSMRFFSDFTVKSKDGRDVLSVTQNRHVKGSVGGSAKEETDLVSGKLPSSVATLIDKDKTSLGCRTYDDEVGKKILAGLKEAVRIADWVSKLDD